MSESKDINPKDEKIYYEFRNASKELKKMKEIRFAVIFVDVFFKVIFDIKFS